MEKNKYVCPKCGATMITIFEKPALNLVCPRCGCRISTSSWNDYDVDGNDYEIILRPVYFPLIKQIRVISKITGYSFIAAKKLLSNGGVLFRVKAADLKRKVAPLDAANIEYSISPLFRY